MRYRLQKLQIFLKLHTRTSTPHIKGRNSWWYGELIFLLRNCLLCCAYPYLDWQCFVLFHILFVYSVQPLRYVLPSLTTLWTTACFFALSCIWKPFIEMYVLIAHVQLRPYFGILRLFIVTLLVCDLMMRCCRRLFIYITVSCNIQASSRGTWSYWKWQSFGKDILSGQKWRRVFYVTIVTAFVACVLFLHLRLRLCLISFHAGFNRFPHMLRGFLLEE